jgi:hypothetical protein
MIAKKPTFDPKKAGQLELYTDRVSKDKDLFAKRVGEGTIGSDIALGKKGILEASIKGNEGDTSGYIGVNIPLPFKKGGLLDRKRS